MGSLIVFSDGTKLEVKQSPGDVDDAIEGTPGKLLKSLKRADDGAEIRVNPAYIRSCERP